MGAGRGHHQHVTTAGVHSKFGIPLAELETVAQLADAADCQVVGLHAHPGSGVLEVTSWAETASLLLPAARRFPRLRSINVGGGLGVPDRREQAVLDLERLDTALGAVRQERRDIEVWLEPGRFVVAGAGVLLARVTQTKTKDDTR
jgi:diaminopimelate decarboxylase/aspartate kinase